MNVLIIKEIKDNENRAAATPETVKKIKELGLEVFVEPGAGENSFLSDSEYENAGAKIGAYDDADVILSVNQPTEHQLDKVKENSCWISMFVPQSDLELVRRLAAKKITFFSMNLIPRISRAQKMDSLSSQSNIAGYKLF